MVPPDPSLSKGLDLTQSGAGVGVGVEGCWGFPYLKILLGKYLLLVYLYWLLLDLSYFILISIVYCPFLCFDD